jgi:acyl-CoA synthetase (AMP-forming)/AMP-acid ligase II/thioesterase domain-containing protein
MGIGRGCVVAIGHGGTARFFADLFATWSLGAAAACLDPTLTPGEIRTVVDFAKPAVLLIDGSAPVGHFAVPIVDLGKEAPKSFSGVEPLIDPNDPALILFTSGTTGAPKGVVLSFRALHTRIEANIAAIGRTPLARTLVTLPTHFGHGLIGNSLTPLLSGGDVVLHPLGIPMTNDLGRIIDEHDITFMSSVPTFWRLALARSPRPSGGSLVRLHVGSAPFPAALWSEVAAWSGAEVVNCYGTTETANWIAGASSRTDDIADGLVGKTWGGDAAVLDESGSIQPTGPGEIIIRSPSLMSGYLTRPDLTAAAFHQGWYRTGDRGSIDKHGRLWLTGRIKDEINRAGFKVQPAEIDALLESNPAIAEACVFGISDPLGGEAIAAAIRLANGANASPQSLQAWCRERLRRDAVPEHWFIVSEIPRSARGKVSRDAVRRALVKEPVPDPGDSNFATRIHKDVVPADPAQARTIRAAVERAWLKILGHESYTADIPLANAGGDSLDALRMWLLIEKLLGTRLSMDVLESDPTPSQLTVALEQQLRAFPGRPAPLASNPTAPVVFLLPSAGGDSPMLARFRDAFKDKIHFVTIEYPRWREMIDDGAGFDVLVNAAVSQIRAQIRESDHCLLVGYSFGGLVAVETARRLADQGRRIGFLGLIDTRASISPTAPPRRWHYIVTALIFMSAFRILRVIGQLAALLPAKQAFAVEFVLNIRLRSESLRRWCLKPLQIPITLYRSDDNSSASPDNGWSVKECRVTVVPIGGTHHSMLAPPFLDILCARILEVVEPVVPYARSDQHVTRATVPGDRDFAIGSAIENQKWN